jgi:hypothetical protein
LRLYKKSKIRSGNYNDIPSLEKAMKEADLPQDAIEGAAGFSEAIMQVEFEETSKDLDNLLRRKPFSLNEFFKEN